MRTFLSTLLLVSALSVVAQTPGYYHPGDVAVVNDIIENNGLQWPKADPVDGSYIPDEWISVGWTEEETENRIISLDLVNQSLTGDLDVSKLTELQQLLCSSWIIIENDNQGDDQQNNDIMNDKYLNRLTSLYASGCTNLQHLDCRFNRLTSLDIWQCEALETIDCATNKLEKLNVEGLTQLKTLYCSSNNLTTLYLTGCTNLAYLYCSENKLSSLDVSGLDNLLWLFCAFNEMTSLDMTGLSNLQWLHCNDNSFISIDLTGLTGLETLACDINKLASLDVTGLSNLTNLSCAYNNLTSLDLSGCASLLSISCSYNNLSTINLPELPELTILNCIENSLTELDFSGLPNLKYLYCNSNKLTELDLSNLPHLEILICNYNNLKALDVTGQPELENLICNDNHLTFLDLRANNNLTWFDGSGQTSWLTFTGDDNYYTANIVFDDGVTFDNAAFSYENGLLTFTGEEVRSFNFISPTGLRDWTLTGNIAASYETVINPANDPLTQVDPLKSYVQNGRLYVCGLMVGEPWRVYHVSGVLVYQDTATGSAANLNLPARGLYIVISGAQSAKAIY